MTPIWPLLLSAALILLAAIIMPKFDTFIVAEEIPAYDATVYVHFTNIPILGDKAVLSMHDTSGYQPFINPWRTNLWPIVSENWINFKISNVMQDENVKMCVKSINSYPGKIACKITKLDNDELSLDFYFDYNKEFYKR